LDDKDTDIINVHKSRQYALKLLSYRGRSEKELEERLRKKGFPETVIFSTIQYLRHRGLIDDMSLAESLKREAMSIKLLGYHGARRFMLHRGIPQPIVDVVLNLYEKEDIENAQKLVDKKLSRLETYPSEKVRRRIYNLLLRKGYSYETIKKIMPYKNFKED